MSYQDTIDYLYSRLPMFSRIGAAAIKNNLDNTIAICDFLGKPQNKFKTIHVAGTNGKGSTSHMLASIFQEAGYKTGLYTSPHLYPLLSQTQALILYFWLLYRNIGIVYPKDFFVSIS